ncbi:2OG-Fe(II) oxygenase [Mangrovimonas sp. YM274]|uniref:2OG-Fe(II) oxygenase n=1 Tax=Mangrovimonas sp. YM274 TaxID=3070660 RepID=UPI0027DB6363|nr:2OG-Fe(II) oxygenase [Mangrovimonas sp. YM274]WMI69118.1 2OG-Fe(II) oxygenase [Mangrovimonas sp. YM274]
MNELFEQLEFVENPLYEKVIADILTQKYSIVEQFFTAEEVAALRDSLMEKHQLDAFKKAAIGNRVNETIEKSIRGDVILWIDEVNANATEQLFFDKINHLVGYLNKTCFMGILQKEFHYALYPKGTFYKRHLDTFQNDDRRKLSFVCYLNEEDWQPENGGELVLYLDENGTEQEKVIYPFPGRVVIFESQLIEHEVKPVDTQRLSITGWLKTR